MSDTLQGPGWWQASDGKWYAPEVHPDAGVVLAPPAPEISPSWHAQPPTPAGPIQTPNKSWWRRWWVIALAVLVVISGIAAIAGPKDESGETLTADTRQPETSTATTSPPDTGGEEQRTAPIASVPETDTVAATAPATTVPVPTAPATTAPALVGTRELPFAIGSSAVITLDTFGDADGSTWALSVDAPGSDITQAVLEENMFNDPPEEGKLFFGVPVTLTLQGAGKEPLSPLFNISLDFFGPSTLEIIAAGSDESCGVVANAIDSFKEVFVGGSISGMVCYAVTPADADAGILLSVDNVEGGRVFLATR